MYVVAFQHRQTAWHGKISLDIWNTCILQNNCLTEQNNSYKVIFINCYDSTFLLDIKYVTKFKYAYARLNNSIY